MSFPLRAIALFGAALLLIGPVVIGVGYLNAAAAEGAFVDCTSNCAAPARAVLNASAESEVLAGVGLALSGIGGGIVLAAALRFVPRRETVRYPRGFEPAPPETAESKVPPAY